MKMHARARRAAGGRFDTRSGIGPAMAMFEHMEITDEEAAETRTIQRSSSK
jgi:hypothetical protein